MTADDRRDAPLRRLCRATPAATGAPSSGRRSSRCSTQSRIAPRYALVREQVGLLNRQLANNLGAIVTIKSFTAEPREVDRIAAESGEYR